MKIFIRKSVLICTLFIFGFLYSLTHVPIKFDLLDPIGKALADFELTDLVFSQLRPEQTLDTNIVLVNIAHLSRAEIGQQIKVLNKYHPKVIGIDAFFRKKKAFEQDIQLIMALSQVENLVMVSDLEKLRDDASCFDSLSTSHPQFNQFAVNGFADVVTSEVSYRTIREVVPKHCLGDSSVISFPAVLAQTLDSSSVEDLLARNNDEESINWRGNYTKFYRLDAQQVLDDEGDFSFIEGKIVLMGFLGEHSLGEKSLEDTFYTPLNKQSAGRADPDMYGVTVHANTISMILKRDYIDTPPVWLDGLIAFILVYLNVAIFIWIGDKFKMYYDLITKVLILAEVAILFGMVIMILLYFQVKINLTVAIIAIIFSGDLTELYIGSLRDLALKWSKRFGFDLERFTTKNP
jgi:CHASE2 domain-containing sensor protein